MFDDLTILVSASGSPTMPGLIKCFKNNGERNIKIIGVDMRDEPSAHFMVDKFYKVPAVTDKNYCDLILDICKNENVDIYFPNISAEVGVVSKRSEEFKEIETIISISEQKSIDIANDKYKTYEYLKKNNIMVPEYYSVDSVEDFVYGCKMLGYPKKPVCLKKTNGSGSRGVRIIDSQIDRYEVFSACKPSSLYASYEDILSMLNETNNIEDLMLVECVLGNEYTVDALADKGKTLYMAGRVNKTSLMSIAQESVVKKIDSAYLDSTKIIELFGYDGNIGFDFLLNESGIPILMDINPRITATVSLFAAAGLNLPYLRIKHLLGEKLLEFNAIEGVGLKRRYSETFYDNYGAEIQY